MTVAFEGAGRNREESGRTRMQSWQGKSASDGPQLLQIGLPFLAAPVL
jgi:hypothetical protein